MAEFVLDTTAKALLVLLVALAVLSVALVVYVARHARGTPAPSEPPAPRELAPGESASLAEVLDGGASPDPFLMRFVDDEKGARVGETITVEGDRVVLKHEGRFLAVPLSKVTVKDDDLVAASDVDWDEAEARGEAWRTSRHDTIEYDEKGNPLPK